MPGIQVGWQRIARFEVNVNKLVSCHIYIHLLWDLMQIAYHSIATYICGRDSDIQNLSRCSEIIS